MRLEDKIILVTGSTTGIGEAIARRAVAEGASVLLHGLEREAGQAVAASLGSRAFFHFDDLADPAAPARIVQQAVARFGGLDALVNNAAWIPRTNLYNTDVATFDKAMAINVRAPMLLICAAMPYLKKTRGAVLNIGSVNAYCGEPNLLPYSISKGALMTLTRNLGDALNREGVRVNQINLGWVLSDNENRVQQAMGKPADWFKHLPAEYAPSGSILLPEQIATAAMYWLSDESRPISGSVCELEQYPVIGRNPPKEPPKDGHRV